MIKAILAYFVITGISLMILLVTLRLLAWLYLTFFCKVFSRKNLHSASKDDNRQEFYKNKKFAKLDDAQLRAKLRIPKSQSQIKAELLSQEEQLPYEIINPEETREEEEVRIVGIVQPIGKWTALILGKKISYLMQQQEGVKGGFWTNMIKARSHSAERERGRSH